MSIANDREVTKDKQIRRPRTEMIKNIDLAKNSKQMYTMPSPAYHKSLSHGLPSNRSSVHVPSSDEIRQITEGFVSSKKRSTETNFYSTFSTTSFSDSQRTYKLPRLVLVKALKGVNTGANWFDENEELNLRDGKGSTRFSAKPNTTGESWNKIFPTREVPFQKVPKTHSERFSLINPKEDLELANYVVNCKNAFKTEWSKHRELKDRKFFPELHPEFIGFSKEHGIKRDRIVIFREEMLKVQNMMKEAWTKKKGPGAKV
ncbi:unnamed protein product [Blepharisma stoltei]|uniref:Uncharacterized protein n=1 Tax=Blepharisma stoltei TaxID=1481888 RepID=A0AAU9K2V3_9CILI|nr:unnamed protein product [Blepharisma stoltei]